MDLENLSLNKLKAEIDRLLFLAFEIMVESTDSPIYSKALGNPITPDLA